MPTTPKIVFLDAGTLQDLPAFEKFSELGDFTYYAQTPDEEVLERAAGAEVVIVNKIEMTRQRIEALPDLRLICVSATGTNNVDKEAAKAHDVEVRNVAGYSTDSVAQLTLTALFVVSMDLIYLNNAVYGGEYSKADDFTMWRQPFHELGGTRFGIIGLGDIGHRVAELATAYGAEVVYHSTSGKNTDQPYPHLSLDELLSSSEVVSIHCALNEHTEGLLGYAELSTMKPSAYLLNMARGGIVVEADLVRALDEEKIKGAAADAFTTEPLPADHPYLSVKFPHRLLLTPHVAWASVEARTRLIRGVADNIRQGW